MARSPFGVPMGVSGDAQTHDGHPRGHVPSESCGLTHPMLGPGRGKPEEKWQQISFEAQHVSPQQTEFGAHMPAFGGSVHGGTMHCRPEQTGALSGQT